MLRPSGTTILGEHMHAVRRTLSTAGLVSILVLAPSAAFAATPTPDPSATASATASPDPTPTPTDSAPPAPSDKPSAQPSSGCEQDPQICQSGGEPETTTDCDPFAASPPPSGVVCIAGGIRPGTTAGNGSGTGAGTDAGAGAGAPGRLPRTGPAPLLPTVTIGLWLLLLGIVVALAGRRRTAHA